MAGSSIPHLSCLPLSAFTDKVGSCSGLLRASVFTEHITKGKLLSLQYWGKDACWSVLGQTKADLGHRLSEHMPCKDRVVSEVTFLNHSSQSLATVGCPFPSLPSLKTLESSFFLSSPSKFH